MSTSEAKAPGGCRRVLIADDNADSVDTLAMLIEMMGHEVRTARDGQAALDAAATFAPQLVLLDIGMPRLNGYDACRRIRLLEGGADMKIVAMTGWGQPEDMRMALEAGFDQHLTKPVEPAAIRLLLA